MVRVMITSKSGHKVTLDTQLNSEGDNNRGWQVDKISAIVEGEEVGYLKLAFIPRERFVRYYPCVFNFMDQIKGHIILPRPKNYTDNDAWREASTKHYLDYNISELRSFLNSLNLAVGRHDISKELAGDTFEELVNRAVGMESFIMNQHQLGKDFKKFETYYVNKPIDDFIRVERDYQREGIAEYLYKVGVKLLESRGLPFYLSTVRQSAAEALAEKFRVNGHIRKMSNGRERFISLGVRPLSLDMGI